MNLLGQLYNDFVIILKNSVIKYNSLAEVYETLDMKKAADEYIRAVRKQDVFETYYHYHRDIIRDILGVDGFEVERIYANRSLIPVEHREAMLLAQRDKIINDYIEKNNYYRTLNGQPKYEDGDSTFVYLDEFNSKKYDISCTIPLHQLSDVDITLLENVGVMDEILQSHPNKDYLKFIGTRRIDIVTARTAKNFGIIRIPREVSSTMWDRFALTYEQCREYFMTCIYVYEHKQTIEYYDNFIAMCIMVQTIQQIIARVIKDTIERNFFDDYCIRALFSAYGVPYYTHMDPLIKTQLVQNLNVLIQNKGTSKVIFDLASILGFDRLKVYKYYLMKEQKFDVRGVPIEAWKIDENTGETVPDYERMYDIYFQKVALDDIDTYKSLLYQTNRVPYQDLTADDPFWEEDETLYKEIYESEFNVIESKYLGVSIAYKLSKILFENVYLIKLIFEKKDELPGVTLSLPKVAPFTTVTIFDALVTLCALTCKHNKLKGEILTRPSAILHVMGFNFQEDFDKIKQDILENKYLDDSLVDFFKYEKTYTADRVNGLYADISGLYDAIVDKMSTTQNIEVYDAYRKLYETLYYTNENQTMFQTGLDDEGNPVYAKTFLDYLKFANPELYTVVNESTDNSHEVYIDHICQKIMEVIPHLQYFGLKADRSYTMETVLVELIRFFKSYTTDMLGLNVVYIFDLKPEMLLKLVDHVHHIHANISVDDGLQLAYSDSLTYTSTVRYNSEMKFIEKVYHIHKLIHVFDMLHLKEHVHITSNISVKDPLDFFDVIRSISNAIWVKSALKFKEVIKVFKELGFKDDLKFDEILHIVTNMTIWERMEWMDTIHSIRASFNFEDSLLLKEVYNIFVNYSFEEKLPFNEFFYFLISISHNEHLPFVDICDIFKLNTVSSKISFSDSATWDSILIPSDVLKFEEIVASSIVMAVKSHVSFFDVIGVVKDIMLCSRIGYRDKAVYKSTPTAMDTLKFAESASSTASFIVNDNMKVLYDIAAMVTTHCVGSNLMLRDSCIISYPELG